MSTQKEIPNALLGVRLTDGLGPKAEDAEYKELTAALDKSGGVVLIDHKGDIVFYAADGKMQVQRLGRECDACIAANMRLAEAVACAWNGVLMMPTGWRQQTSEKLRAQHELIQKLKAALDGCIDEAEQAVTDHVLSFGEDWRPVRLAALRKQVADARAALAAAEAHK